MIVPVPGHGSLAVLARGADADLAAVGKVAARVEDAIVWERGNRDRLLRARRRRSRRRTAVSWPTARPCRAGRSAGGSLPPGSGDRPRTARRLFSRRSARERLGGRAGAALRRHQALDVLQDFAERLSRLRIESRAPVQFLVQFGELLAQSFWVHGVTPLEVRRRSLCHSLGRQARHFDIARAGGGERSRGSARRRRAETRPRRTAD